MQSNCKADQRPITATFLQQWRRQLRLVMQKPWLASRWLEQSRTLFKRYSQFYAHLCNQPRPIRRRLQRQLGTSLAGVAFALALVNSPTQAADFTANDAPTLIAAINAANDEITNPGADTITLTGDVTLTTYSYDNGTFYSGLPPITSTITIEGAGFTIARDVEAEDPFGLLLVAAPGDLTLNQITLTGGLSLIGGAIFNADGVVTVNQSTITGNTGYIGGAIVSISPDSSTEISNSTFTSNIGAKYGSAFTNLGTATLTNSTVENNANKYVGGSVANLGMLTITGSTIDTNTSEYGSGAGILNYNGVLTVNQSTITNNVATGNEENGGRGGGVYNRNGDVTLTDSTISGNNSGFSGGGLFNYYAATPTVSSASQQVPAALTEKLQTLGINAAQMNAWETKVAQSKMQSAARAHAEAAEAGTMTLVNSTVSNNTAGTNTATARVNDDDGGGIVNKGGSLILTNSTVSGNQAPNNTGGFDGVGGGIYNTYDGTLTLNNSTLTGNDAGSIGGGIVNLGELTLDRSLIAGNSASSAGNEIHNYVGCLTAATINSPACLVSMNTVTADAFNLIGHSGESNAEAIYGFTPGASDITTTSNGTKPTTLSNILNSTLASNGAPSGHPTLTHALVAGSPAIDAAGDGSLDTDQRGVSRPQGTADDIGAMEVKVLNSSVTQTSVTASNNPTPQSCPATGSNLAIYTVTPTLRNTSSTTFTDLFFRVKTLEYTTSQGGQQPSLCNASTVVNNGGVGSMLAIPNSSLPGSDSQFNPNDNLIQALQVGRPVAAQFRIKVDLYSSTAAASADGSNSESYLGSFEYVFDPTSEESLPDSTLFLPLVTK